MKEGTGTVISSATTPQGSGKKNKKTKKKKKRRSVTTKFIQNAIFPLTGRAIPQDTPPSSPEQDGTTVPATATVKPSPLKTRSGTVAGILPKIPGATLFTALSNTATKIMTPTTNVVESEEGKDTNEDIQIYEAVPLVENGTDHQDSLDVSGSLMGSTLDSPKRLTLIGLDRLNTAINRILKEDPGDIKELPHPLHNIRTVAEAIAGIVNQGSRGWNLYVTESQVQARLEMIPPDRRIVLEDHVWNCVAYDNVDIHYQSKVAEACITFVVVTSEPEDLMSSKTSPITNEHGSFRGSPTRTPFDPMKIQGGQHLSLPSKQTDTTVPKLTGSPAGSTREPFQRSPPPHEELFDGQTSQDQRTGLTSQPEKDVSETMTHPKAGFHNHESLRTASKSGKRVSFDDSDREPVGDNNEQSVTSYQADTNAIKNLSCFLDPKVQFGDNQDFPYRTKRDDGVLSINRGEIPTRGPAGRTMVTVGTGDRDEIKGTPGPIISTFILQNPRFHPASPKAAPLLQDVTSTPGRSPLSMGAAMVMVPAENQIAWDLGWVRLTKLIYAIAGMSDWNKAVFHHTVTYGDTLFMAYNLIRDANSADWRPENPYPLFLRIVRITTSLTHVQQMAREVHKASTSNTSSEDSIPDLTDSIRNLTLERDPLLIDLISDLKDYQLRHGSFPEYSDSPFRLQLRDISLIADTPLKQDTDPKHTDLVSGPLTVDSQEASISSPPTGPKPTVIESTMKQQTTGATYDTPFPGANEVSPLANMLLTLFEDQVSKGDRESVLAELTENYNELIQEKGLSMPPLIPRSGVGKSGSASTSTMTNATPGSRGVVDIQPSCDSQNEWTIIPSKDEGVRIRVNNDLQAFPMDPMEPLEFPEVPPPMHSTHYEGRWMPTKGVPNGRTWRPYFLSTIGQLAPNTSRELHHWNGRRLPSGQAILLMKGDGHHYDYALPTPGKPCCEGTTYPYWIAINQNKVHSLRRDTDRRHGTPSTPGDRAASRSRQSAGRPSSHVSRHAPVLPSGEEPKPNPQGKFNPYRTASKPPPATRNRFGTPQSKTKHIPGSHAWPDDLADADMHLHVPESLPSPSAPINPGAYAPTYGLPHGSPIYSAHEYDGGDRAMIAYDANTNPEVPRPTLHKFHPRDNRVTVDYHAFDFQNTKTDKSYPDDISLDNPWGGPPGRYIPKRRYPEGHDLGPGGDFDPDYPSGPLRLNNTPRAAVEPFAVKPDLSVYPTIRHEKNFYGWYTEFTVVLRAQGLGCLTYKDYTPRTVDEHEEYLKRCTFCFLALLKSVQNSRLGRVIKFYKPNCQGHKALHALWQEFASSATAFLQLEHDRDDIDAMRYTEEDKSSAVEAIDTYTSMVEVYNERLGPSSQLHITDTAAMQGLQRMVRDCSRLDNVKSTMYITGKEADYYKYIDLLRKTASFMDEAAKNQREGRNRPRRGYLTDIADSTSEATPSITANVAQGSRPVDTSARIPDDKWQGLPVEAKRSWTRIPSDDRKALIQAFLEGPSTGKRTINLATISDHDGSSVDPSPDHDPPPEPSSTTTDDQDSREVTVAIREASNLESRRAYTVSRHSGMPPSSPQDVRFANTLARPAIVTVDDYPDDTVIHHGTTDYTINHQSSTLADDIAISEAHPGDIRKILGRIDKPTPRPTPSQDAKSVSAFSINGKGSSRRPHPTSSPPARGHASYGEFAHSLLTRRTRGTGAKEVERDGRSAFTIETGDDLDEDPRNLTETQNEWDAIVEGGNDGAPDF